MKLTSEEQAMLAGEHGRAARKAMEILVALGEIYAAECMLPVTSVQIAGVSYDNLGEAGLEFLQEMADGGGRARVLATLNPAGMDVENWQALGIPADFAANQQRVLEAFAHMGVQVTCTCTPYLSGNTPGFGEHRLGRATVLLRQLRAGAQREGGPSARQRRSPGAPYSWTSQACYYPKCAPGMQKHAFGPWAGPSATIGNPQAAPVLRL
jgi:hypothetical protein